MLSGVKLIKSSMYGVWKVMHEYFPIAAQTFLSHVE
jgi:hypothetical protein